MAGQKNREKTIMKQHEIYLATSKAKLLQATTPTATTMHVYDKGKTINAF